MRSPGNQHVAGNPDILAMRPHTLGVMSPVTLNDSGEWIDASKHKKNSEPGWAQRSHHEVEIPKERGRDNKNNNVTALAGGCKGNNTKEHIHSSVGKLLLESAVGGTLTPHLLIHGSALA